MSEALSGPDGPGGSDDRIIRETGLDARVAGIVRPVLAAAGFRLVRVRMTGQNGLTLQIMAEREDGSMDVDGCEEASRAISPALDVEDPIEKAYHLEVSSPGIDRPLVRKDDFAAATGHLAKLETTAPVEERRRFRGRIVAVDGESLVIERDQPAYGEAPTVRVPFDVLADAKLILTDDLIREALRKDKELRRAANDDGDVDEADDGEADDGTETQN